MNNSNLTKPFAWAALIHGYKPEGRDIATQLGEAVAFVVDEPTLEIITHDAEVARWEDAREWLELVVDDFAAMLEARLADRDRAEALAMLQDLNAEVVEPTPDPELRFEVQLAKNALYAIGTCAVGKCRHFASGTVPQVEAAMAEHVAQEHATKATADIVTTLDPAPEAKAKSRCATHGVWARESDGRCKRCDTPEVAQEDVLAKVREALTQKGGGITLPEDAGQALTAVLVEALKAKAAREAKAPVQVTQEQRPDAPAKLTLGVRGNGMLARRSAHELAPYVKATQRELAKMTADEARALVSAAGIDADWVPAKEL